MIEYENGSSPFLLANTNYCKEIETELEKKGIECVGYCNSYGYNVNFQAVENCLVFDVKYIKHQTTRNGVIVPLNANDYTGAEIEVGGLEKSRKLRIGKSSFKRLFTKAKFKTILPEPYYLNSNYEINVTRLQKLVGEIVANKVADLSLRNGKLKLKIHQARVMPLMFIGDIEELANDWR